MAEVAFSSVDAARLSGATYRQLDYWCRTGRVEPSIDPGHGSGSARRYAIADIVALAILVELGRSAWAPAGRLNRNTHVEAEVNRRVASVIASRQFSEDQCLVLRGTEALLLSRRAVLVAVADADTAVTVVPLAPIFERIREGGTAARVALDGYLGLEVVGG